jgi:hypothetical protein
MTQDCKVCLVQHDEEIHAATNRVHARFRAQVTKHLHDVGDNPMLDEGNEPGALDRPCMQTGDHEFTSASAS